MKAMIITGASRGIGAATALLAAEQGFAVAVNYNKNKAAAEKALAVAGRKLDKAVSKGAIHRNNAANRKSGAATRVNAMDA